MGKGTETDLRFWRCALLTIQVDPFIAFCHLLALPVQYRRAEPQQGSFSAAWVQLRTARARPMALMASAVRGMRVVYDKEGIDPCGGDAHYGGCVHQRRGRCKHRGHNRTGEACPEGIEGTMRTRT